MGRHYQYSHFIDEETEAKGHTALNMSINSRWSSRAQLKDGCPQEVAPVPPAPLVSLVTGVVVVVGFLHPAPLASQVSLTPRWPEVARPSGPGSSLHH